MKYSFEYEVAVAMKYALRIKWDLFYFIFCFKAKYFIIHTDYFILRSNISLIKGVLNEGK